jgi:uncharacterized repeat protein (TIGR01451 family)
VILRKATLGGTGTVSFQVSKVGEPSLTYRQAATTTRVATPVRAKGEDTSSLPLGAYDITESSARANDGRWALAYVLCNGKPVGAEQGRIRVVLTRRTPKVRCTFVDQHHDQPVPPQPSPPPTPTPPNPGGNVEPSRDADGPVADLAVTKSVSPAVAQPGQPVRYTVTVTNRGPSTANDVVVAELSPPSHRRLSISTTRGSCRGDRPAHCAIGTLAPGQRAVITVRTTALDTGVTVNRVAVASSSRDPVLVNNIDSARLAVVRLRPQFTG